MIRDIVENKSIVIHSKILAYICLECRVTVSELIFAVLINFRIIRRGEDMQGHQWDQFHKKKKRARESYKNWSVQEACFLSQANLAVYLPTREVVSSRV